MKKLFILAAFMLTFSFANAQVKKADIVQALVDIGITLKDVKEVFVSNIILTYTDKTWIRSSEAWKKEDVKTFEVSLTDSGLKIVMTYNDDTRNFVIFPYSEMRKIYVNSTGYIAIALRD